MKYLTRFANVIALLVIAQVTFFGALVWQLHRLYLPASIALIALSVLCVLFIATGETHPIFRLTWTVVIMFMPIFGGIIYVFYNRRNIGRLVERSFAQSYNRALTERSREHENINILRETDPNSYRTALYLENAVGFSPAQVNDCKYFPVGEDKLAYLINEMRNAEKYIFLEYFIIEEGIVWDTIFEILEQKAAEGIDVRLIIDGAGCLYPLPWKFKKQMEQAGIKIRIFNPVRPLVSVRITARNHRKIAVIDGKKAFCGGLNLADQYVNIKEMFGHFKDSAVMVDSGTAWDMTLMFLSMWEFLDKKGEKINYNDFRPAPHLKRGDSGRDVRNGIAPYAVPMLDIPHDKTTVSEHTFISFISRAEEYVYVTTPYLMCGGEILSALYTAARSGVDVRIIVPYIADKRLVNAVTKSYYRSLLENHVRLFEYVPGFIHAKNLIADGKRAMVGTVNLDYISLYLHYECGICFFKNTGGKNSIVDEIDRDFTETLDKCKEVTLYDINRWSLTKRTLQRTSRLFAPFL